MPSPRIKPQPGRAEVRRCAVYTRKSSEEGLEQEFNSLDAQREACEAYARSQRHEGWVLVSTHYDDGRISGGTLERPALQRLLADIRAGKVDLVLVYKVDRLTRSLADFAKIVEVLDAHGASFVSVTQQFNTATSMGRLTLNMLLSFAQFEREVAGERIRDKIAASKRKGMWMGGTVPFGYEVRDRKLVINETEAETVRHIFRRYLGLGSVRLLQEQLASAGIVGRAGRPLGRGPLFHLLQNRTYRGEIVHKGAVYPGEQAAIIDRELWDAVQQQFATNRYERTTGKRARSPSLLAGLLFDHAGEPMTATHAVKRNKRYRYYVSRSLVTGNRDANPEGRRVPAGDIEQMVSERLQKLFADRSALFPGLQQAGTLPTDVDAQQRLLRQAGQLARRWSEPSPSEQRNILRLMLARVEVQQDQVEVQVNPAALGTLLLGDPRANEIINPISVVTPLVLSISASLRRSGQEMTLLVDGPAPAGRPNPALIRLIAKSHALRDALMTSDAESIATFAHREGLSKSYVTRLVRLAYLAPVIVEAILDGRQPTGLTTTRLMQDTRLPLGWQEQKRALGFA
jgi:DNA invertase Pin-like site-specific DNA recombinase